MNNRLIGASLWACMVLYSSFVLTLLWQWFVTPFGLTPISLPWALGLMSIVSLLNSPPHPDSKTSMFGMALIQVYCISLAWAVGFLASLFM